MRFRAGLVAGFAFGFYFGSWAGRQRFHQINAAITSRVRGGAIGTASEKAKAVVELGVERARDIVESKFGSDRDLVGSGQPLEPGPAVHSPAHTNGDAAT